MRRGGHTSAALSGRGSAWACFARSDNFPAAEGHTEIAPKRHVESFFGLTPQEVRDAYALILTVRTDPAAATGRAVGHRARLHPSGPEARRYGVDQHEARWS
ncbi:HIT domain-containing protein [Solwaraspora sp. WMMB335]|uniref:HIT domain-containing protein n=1 Tax=Solwaraspora sp. WMMB335 TaxID=3404118 RepID=UPI003B95B072